MPVRSATPSTGGWTGGWTRDRARAGA